MGKHTGVEWCDHTFNIIFGCSKVSGGCKFCYADGIATRFGFDVWGPPATTARKTMSAAYWQQPLRWNRAAVKAGKIASVFCCSMGDVFEEHPTVRQEQQKLWALIDSTPNLFWLLLTKRPQNIRAHIPQSWLERPRRNVGFGTSCESQETAQQRIPHLVDVPAYLRFLSCEPLLGPLDLAAWLAPVANGDCGGCVDRHSEGTHWLGSIQHPAGAPIHWVIGGGESGPKARPCHPDWARSLRDQCVHYSTPFFWKQWGEWVAPDHLDGDLANDLLLASRKGWDDYRQKHFSTSAWAGQTVVRLGKKTAGCLLDGSTWNEFPLVLR